MKKFYNSKGVYKTRIDGDKTKACQLWENIRNRMYYLPKMNESKFGKYSLVDICDSWCDFQNFAKWVADNQYYHKGWVLDKDLLTTSGKGVYGPETCVFLPDEVNKALNTKSRCRGMYPLGVSRIGKSEMLSVQYDCKNPDYAFRESVTHERLSDVWHSKYKKAREGYIHNLGEMYKHQLDPRAYVAIMNYEINMED